MSQIYSGPERPHGPSNGHHAPPPQQHHRAVNIFALMWSRKWLLLLGGVIGAGLAFLYSSRITPVYQSTAQVLIQAKENRLPIGDVSLVGPRRESLENHILAIRSPQVIGMAVKKYNLTSLGSFAGMSEGQIVSSLAKGLSAKPAVSSPGMASNSDVLVLFLLGSDPRDTSAALNAIVGAYQDFLGQTYQDVSQETVQLITKARTELAEQLEKNQRDYAAFRETSPLLPQGQTSSNIHESRLLAIESERAAIILQRISLESHLKFLESAIANGMNREALAMMISRTGGGEGTRGAESAESALVSKLVQEKVLLGDHGPEHPRVLSLRREIEALREINRQMQSTQTAETQQVQFDTFAQKYMESIRGELTDLQYKETVLNEQFDAERQRARSLSGAQNREEQLRGDIARTQALFDAVIKRLEEINLIKDHGGYRFQILASASFGNQTEPDVASIIGYGVFMGLAAGFGIAFLIERADRTFRTPDEIRQQLQVPILGHIPVIPEHRHREAAEAEGNGEAVMDPRLCTWHVPRSRLAEAYRAVRTSLYFSVQNSDVRVVQVTSPEAGDGKSTLSANLAIAIAKSGRRVVLIDADFRRPRLHKMFGLEGDGEIGLSTAITGEVAVDDALRASEVENLSLLPCGKKPSEPAELLTTQRFGQVLDRLKELFDIIVIDTPPVLAVTDPCIVASHADGVILTIRISRQSQRLAKRSLEMLGSLGANVLGVVVNGVAASRGYDEVSYYRQPSNYYYYGGYGYGYGYRYGAGAYRDANQAYYDDKGNGKANVNGSTTTQ